MTMEIDIHRSLSHLHVVGFHGFFEDKDHVYILLELCRRRSLMELHKRRRALSEPEVRYYLKQILLAVEHLHGVKVRMLHGVKVRMLHGVKVHGVKVRMLHGVKVRMLHGVKVRMLHGVKVLTYVAWCQGTYVCCMVSRYLRMLHGVKVYVAWCQGTYVCCMVSRYLRRYVAWCQGTYVCCMVSRYSMLHGVKVRMLHGVKVRMLHGVKVRMLHGVKARMLHGVKARMLHGVKVRMLHGVMVRMLHGLLLSIAKPLSSPGKLFCYRPGKRFGLCCALNRTIWSPLSSHFLNNRIADVTTFSCSIYYNTGDSQRSEAREPVFERQPGDQSWRFWACNKSRARWGEKKVIVWHQLPNCGMGGVGHLVYVRDAGFLFLEGGRFLL